ncbi:CBS domain-containing protein [Pseudomaricurvus alkylphenolicus]|jgi:CBS-domain-containing membrane protein|uniref:CBS domain-containing protein n=1 Tax=Pseudomaricurvus alkylphenolicus TaxID=1306991 RepID=UPI00142438B0|nr:CBS domain-containing protein [Pseudomaricurvus alkylphenolicus]NIB40719.1 CBS domain-containing protein [Pseudomaricurvus alkylphenolicus]
MPFQVYELGRRIETPWQSIFPPRSVDQLQEPAAAVPLSANDQLKESQLPHGSAGGGNAEAIEVLRGIQSSAEKERRPVYQAGQIMSKPVVTLPLSASLRLAQDMFQRHGFRHFPVADSHQRVHGLVSDRDLLAATSELSAAGRQYPTSAKVTAVMHGQVLTASADTNLRYLAEVMLAHHVGSMPILDEDGRLQGMVTRSDILRTITHQVPIELWS